MKDNIERTVVSIFVVTLAVLVIAALVAIRNIQSSIDTSDWVNHTHAVILEGDAVLSSLHAGEAALRNYVLTGDKRDQGAYRAAFNEMVEHLAVAKALTRREKPQQQQFLELEGLLGKRIQFTRELSQITEKEGLEGVRKQLATDDGTLLREIEHLARKMEEGQNVLLQERDRASYRQAQATRWTVITGVTLNFLLLAFAGWLIRDDLAARRRAAEILQQANNQLEATVRERTAELVEANQSLKKQNLERQWANQALAHQLHYSDLIFGSIKELVFVVSKAQHISRLNPEVLHATGFEAPELIGSPLRKVLEILPETSPDGSYQQPVLTRALKEGREIEETPAVLRCKNGQPTPLRISLVPLRDRDKVVGGVITARLANTRNHEPA
jgi:PAS domain S-box-containing protein